MKFKSIKQLEKEIEGFEQEAKEQGWSGDEEKDWISDFIGERDLHTYFELKAQLSQTKEIVKIIEKKSKEYEKYWLDAHKKGDKQAEDIFYNTYSNLQELLAELKGEEG